MIPSRKFDEKMADRLMAAMREKRGRIWTVETGLLVRSGQGVK